MSRKYWRLCAGVRADAAACACTIGQAASAKDTNTVTRGLGIISFLAAWHGYRHHRAGALRELYALQYREDCANERLRGPRLDGATWDPRFPCRIAECFLSAGRQRR